MVDRLEELLALMEEEDEEEREDGLALGAAEVPAAFDSERGTEERGASARDEAEKITAESESLVRMPEGWTAWTDRRDEVPGADGAEDEGAAGDGGAEDEAAGFLWDGLAAAVMGPGGAAVLRRPGAGDVEIGELAGGSRQSDGAAELDTVDALTAEERGLEGLYRQAVRAGRPAAENLPVERAERTVRAEEPGRSAALSVEELDRAVRRDSWRYDGGMTIF